MKTLASILALVLLVCSLAIPLDASAAPRGRRGFNSRGNCARGVCNARGFDNRGVDIRVDRRGNVRILAD